MCMHHVKQCFDVLNHLKATDGLKNLPPTAFDHSGKHQKFPSLMPRNRSTYISCDGSAYEVCVFVRVSASCASV